MTSGRRVSLVLGSGGARGYAHIGAIRYRLAGFSPDVLITVPKDACLTFDFHRVAEIVELGRELAARALDRHEAGC